MKARAVKNVFQDLGFAPEDAANLRIRAALMVALTEQIRKADLTQHEAAKRLGVSQPRVSDLIRGKIEVFSIDTLVAMLSRLGVKTSILVGNKKIA